MCFVGMETPSSSELHLVRGNLVCVCGGGGGCRPCNTFGWRGGGHGGVDHVTHLAGGAGGGGMVV